MCGYNRRALGGRGSEEQAGAHAVAQELHAEAGELVQQDQDHCDGEAKEHDGSENAADHVSDSTRHGS